MPIKSNLDKHTVSWLNRQNAEGKLNKNISIQRKEIWDEAKKSNLIISLLLDIPIESLLFEEAENGTFNVLDGKQRTLSFCAFIDGEFALSPKIRVKEIGGQALAGLKFAELPKAMQNRILDYEISISVLRPLGEDERATVFFMRNQAAALSKMDLSRVLLGEKHLNAFQAMCEHPFFREKVKLTEPARRKNADLLALLQYLILMKRPEAGFSGAEVMTFCDDVNAGEIDLTGASVSAVLDYLDQAFADKRQYFKKVHIPVALFVATQALERGVEPARFSELLDAFFGKLDPGGEYMAACKSASSKRVNVQTRVRIMSGILPDGALEIQEAAEPQQGQLKKKRGGGK